MSFKRFLAVCVLFLALAGSVAIAFNGRQGAKTITVGSKGYSGDILLGEIFAQLIEAKTDIEVARKLNMGDTAECFQAMENGDIDLCPEFVGAGLAVQLGLGEITADEEAGAVSLQFEQRYGVKWLEPLGFCNCFAIAVSDEVYQEYHVETCSDLAAVSQELVFGGQREFFERQDGYDGLLRTYGFQFRDKPKEMNELLKYEAVGNGGIDVISVFDTDGLAEGYNLKVLKDDKGYFTRYDVAPMVRCSTLQEYPELEEVLNELTGRIDQATMTRLNYRVDVENRDVTAVAAEFLADAGLVKKFN